MKKILLMCAVAVGLSAMPVKAASISDVTFRGQEAQAIFGDIAGNDTLAALNLLPGAGGAWEDLVRDNGTEGTVTYNGVNWTLRADNAQTTGAWQLLLEDPAPANLPMSIDFMVVLKGSNSWSAYEFSGQTFGPSDLTNDGKFAISIVNNGGQTPGLSHMSLYFRNGETLCAEGACPGDTTVPEPTSLALLGLALLGAGFARRRK